MNLGKTIITLVLAGVIVAQAAPPPLVGNLENQEKGPSFSSPQVKMHENGDRVSHYPPYYHPESGGRK